MMNRYIALLRAINVGGYRKIKMNDLKAMMRSLGFENVDTYIQSGNIVFDAPTDAPQTLGSTITKNIKSQFGYDVPAIIRTQAEFAAILASVPFEPNEGWKRYISFLTKTPERAATRELENLSTDIELFEVQGAHVYSLVNKQADIKPRFSNGFIEKQLDMPATTRNLRTSQKIMDLAGG